MNHPQISVGFTCRKISFSEGAHVVTVKQVSPAPSAHVPTGVAEPKGLRSEADILGNAGICFPFSPEGDSCGCNVHLRVIRHLRPPFSRQGIIDRLQVIRLCRNRNL